jgi:hypothetical protein
MTIADANLRRSLGIESTTVSGNVITSTISVRPEIYNNFNIVLTNPCNGSILATIPILSTAWTLINWRPYVEDEYAIQVETTTITTIAYELRDTKTNNLIPALENDIAVQINTYLI